MFLIALIFLGNSPKLLGNEMSPLALSKKFKAPLAFGTRPYYTNFRRSNSVAWLEFLRLFDFRNFYYSQVGFD